MDQILLVLRLTNRLNNRNVSGHLKRVELKQNRTKVWGILVKTGTLF